VSGNEWELSPEKVNRLNELQKEMDELRASNPAQALVKPNGDVIDVESKPVEEPSEFDLMTARYGNILESIATAVKSGRMMVAVYYQENDRVMLSRHTHGFNTGDYETACRLLRENLLGEPSAETVRPLPRANVIKAKPSEVLFGKQPDEMPEKPETK
jgi:hypothetical protein